MLCHDRGQAGVAGGVAVVELIAVKVTWAVEETAGTL
jgi:hypothetical protein